jgi:hypothetical protein
MCVTNCGHVLCKDCYKVFAVQICPLCCERITGHKELTNADLCKQIEIQNEREKITAYKKAIERKDVHALYNDITGLSARDLTELVENPEICGSLTNLSGELLNVLLQRLEILNGPSSGPCSADSAPASAAVGVFGKCAPSELFDLMEQRKATEAPSVVNPEARRKVAFLIDELERRLSGYLFLPGCTDGAELEKSFRELLRGWEVQGLMSIRDRMQVGLTELQRMGISTDAIANAPLRPVQKEQLGRVVAFVRVATEMCSRVKIS